MNGSSFKASSSAFCLSNCKKYKLLVVNRQKNILECIVRKKSDAI